MGFALYIFINILLVHLSFYISMPTNKDFIELCKTSLWWNRDELLKYITNYALKANESKKYSLYNDLVTLINNYSQPLYSISSVEKKIGMDSKIWIPDTHKDQVSTFIEYVRKSAREHSPFNRILLYWPPWTWKTTLWRHIARSIWDQVNYVKISDIIWSKLWETLQNIDKVFKDPDKRIIFLDEFDVYAKNRQDTNDIWELKRTVNSFIQTLDNPEYNKIVIVSTNIVSEIDPAIMRRFKFKMHIDYLSDFEAISFITYLTWNDTTLSLKKKEIESLVHLSKFKSVDDVITCIDLSRIHKMIQWWEKMITFWDLVESASKEWFISKETLKTLKKDDPKASKSLYSFIKSNYWISHFTKILNVHRNTFRSLFAV